MWQVVRAGGEVRPAEMQEAGAVRGYPVREAAVAVAANADAADATPPLLRYQRLPIAVDKETRQQERQVQQVRVVTRAEKCTSVCATGVRPARAAARSSSVPIEICRYARPRLMPLCLPCRAIRCRRLRPPRPLLLPSGVQAQRHAALMLPATPPRKTP